MSVFHREGYGWVSKFMLRGRQRWTPGSPWSTREEAEQAERDHREAIRVGLNARAARSGLPHTVYCLFAGDELVYIGITAGGVRRLGDHRGNKPWWREITRATFEHVDGLAAAEAWETALIQEHAPRYNRAKKREVAPPGLVTADELAVHIRYKRATVIVLVEEGLLPVATRDEVGRPFFDLATVDDWIRAGRAERLPPQNGPNSGRTGNSAVADSKRAR